MYVADWITKLDDFLRLSDRDILTHAGKVSREAATAKAELEYDRFTAQNAALPPPVERHFEQAIKGVQQIDKARKARSPRKPKKGT